MSIPEKNLQPEKNYMPAVLKKYSKDWRIEYYALNPSSGQLHRKQVKLNLLAKRYSKVSEFREHANRIVASLNIRLSSGWSPFFTSEDVRLYTDIKDVAKFFIAEKRRELRLNTLRSYESFCRIFLEWCEKNYADKFCSTFNRLAAVRYMDYVYNKRKASAVTYNNQLKMARAFFSWAKEKCYCKENPFELIKTKRPTPKKRIMIAPEVRERLREAAKPNYIIVMDLVYTSLIRPKEINIIQLKHIHLEQKYIEIPGENAKNGKTRFAPLSPFAVESLNGLITSKMPKDWFLFGSELQPDGRPCSSIRFAKEWDKLRKKLNLPMEMQLYSLRDTGINEKLKAGIDPLTVMQAADHHDLAMTTRYANHADPNLIKIIYEKAPKF